MCKLLENNPPETERRFVVTRRSTVLLAHPVMSQLASTYDRTLQRDGAGTWSNRRFESVVSSITQVVLHHMNTPCVFERAAFIDLVAAYLEQEKQHVPMEESTKAQLAQELLLASGVGDRKRAAADSKGTCWLCGAPKPRKTTCMVCGYTPRTRGM